MVRIAIIEDEEKEYQVLKSFLDRYSKEHDVAFAVDYFNEAVNFVSDYHFNYDLIFLDIMMPGLDGMRVAERIRKIDKNVTLVFVTNMEQYAIQGYDVHAHYFMVKPLKYEDFELKLENTLTYINKKNDDKYIMLYLPFDEIHKVCVKDIRYIEVFSHDLIIHLFDEEIKMRGRLSDFEKQLSPKLFCRVNSCYIVNLSYVKTVKDRTISLGDVELIVSHARKKALYKALSDYVLREE